MLQRIAKFVDRVLCVTRPQNPVVLPPETSLLELGGFAPPGFSHGLEILNDQRTPMQFVVDLLNTHMGLSHHDSIRIMLDIHNRGGALLPTVSATEARRIAAAITADAAREKHPLACRAVSNAAKV
jgi:ATP-dependent Clp protease adapter protein ClpS